MAATMAEAESTSPGNSFNTEAYDSIVENDFRLAADEPQSTFAIDVDTASYSNIRRMLTDGQRPVPGAVRIEELVNYFSYDYPEPQGEHPFTVTARVTECPWMPGHQLLRVGLKGRSIDHRHRSPCNLVFLLDVSGSMMQPNKLPLVQLSMKSLVRELAADDRVAIVVYAGQSGLVLPSTPVSEATTILEAIDQLRAGGSTNGGAGIRLAYDVAQENFRTNGINRVILCTDGDFNVGTTSQSELMDLISHQAKGNVFLTVLGFGTGNLKDSTMEKLADKGNGNYAYIDGPMEARKVLIEQVGSTLFTIAKDVKLQVDFNPLHVGAYRLLGYENRLLANQDFRNDAKDAGELGAGHMVTALYELIPPGQESNLTPPRPSEFVAKNPTSDRRGSGEANTKSDTMLTVNLRYKQPTSDRAIEFQVRVPAGGIGPPDSDTRFASAVAGYGLLLRNSQYKGQLDWNWVIETAEQALAEDRMGLRREFVHLAKTARRLSQ